MDNTRPAIVYQATNLINGNTYIGITVKSLRSRATQHWCQRIESKTAMGRALQKYGRDMIRFRTLIRCKTFSEALREEVRLIALFRPRYNLTSGGEGSAGSRRHSRAAKEIGKRVAKQVICLADGKIFASAKAATLHYGLHKGCVSRIASGAGKATSTGLKFAFVKPEHVRPPKQSKARPKGFVAKNRGTTHTDETKAKMRAWRAAHPEHLPWLGRKRDGKGFAL